MPERQTLKVSTQLRLEWSNRLHNPLCTACTQRAHHCITQHQGMKCTSRSAPEAEIRRLEEAGWNARSNTRLS